MKQTSNHYRLTNDTRYIAIIPNGWGKGDTIKEAVKNAKSAVGTSNPRYTVVFSYPKLKEKTVYMDGMGTLHGEGLVKLSDNRESK